MLCVFLLKFFGLYFELCDDVSACDEPPKLPNAVLNVPGDTLVGTVRSYQCLKGFQPTGPIEVTCIGANGVTMWDSSQHGCVGEYMRMPSIRAKLYVTKKITVTVHKEKRYNRSVTNCWYTWLY